MSDEDAVDLAHDGAVAAWDPNQPREWFVTMAVRVAVRRVPRALLPESRPRDLSTLYTLRATLLSWIAARYPSSRTRDAAKYAALDLTGGGGRDRNIAMHAAYAAAAPESRRALEHLRIALRRCKDEEVEHARLDYVALANGIAPVVLLSTPLWHSAPTNLFGTPLDTFRSGAVESHWRIWVEWYGSRLDGRPTFDLSAERAKEIDLRIAEQDEGWWARGAASVNPQIANWVEAARLDSRTTVSVPTVAGFIIEYLREVGRPATNAEIEQAYRRARGVAASKTIRGELSRLASAGRIIRVEVGLYSASIVDPRGVEPQSSIGLRFRTTSDGRIDIDPETLSALLRQDRDAKDRHAETLRLAREMVAVYDPTAVGANAARAAVDEVERFIASLGDGPRSVRPGLLLPRGDSLRQLRAAQESREADSDLPPLPDAMRLALGKLVSAYNTYVGLDPELSRQDEARLGPDAIAILVSPSVGVLAVRSAVMLGAATIQAQEAVADEAKVAPGTPNPDSRLSRRFSEGAKNFVRALLGRLVTGSVWIAKNPVKAAAGAAAAGAGFIAGANWVLAHQIWVESIFANNPAMLEVIRQLVAWLRTLPLA
jgi:hypothetical protein